LFVKIFFNYSLFFWLRDSATRNTACSESTFPEERGKHAAARVAEPLPLHSAAEPRNERYTLNSYFPSARNKTDLALFTIYICWLHK